MRRETNALFLVVRSSAHVCVCVMLYHALRSEWATLGHPGRGEDEGPDETMWRSRFGLLITGCSTSGRKTEGSFEDRVIKGLQMTHIGGVGLTLWSTP